MNDTQAKLIRWASRCSCAIRDAFDLNRSIFDENRSGDSETDFVQEQLALSCHLTSESALILVGNVRVWDADILVRSVVEGTFKFVYLSSGTSEEQEKNTHEYWNILHDINRLKRHQRAVQLLGAIDNPNADSWQPIRELILGETEFEQLQTKYPKKSRQSIEQRWSFAELGQTIAKENPGTGLDLLKHLMFGYGMASHLAHQDADAVGMVWERTQRACERYESVQVAHGARAISDILVMAVLRAMILHKLYRKDKKPVLDLFNKENELLSEMREYQAEWHGIEYGKAKLGGQ